MTSHEGRCPSPLLTKPFYIMLEANYTVLYFERYDCPKFIDVDTFSEAKQIAKGHRDSVIYDNMTDALIDTEGNITEW